MALAFDAASGADIATTNDLTWSHTCTGSNRILFVSLYNGGQGSPTDRTITYAGASMTYLTIASATDGSFVQLYYLIAPATGTNSIIIHDSVGNVPMGAAAASYTGASQSGQPDNTNTGSVAGTSLTTSIVTSADNCWVVLGGVAFNALTASTGATVRGTVRNNIVGIFDSNGVVHPAGSYSMTVTNNNANIGVVLASFAPVGAVGVSLPFKSLMGVGI